MNIMLLGTSFNGLEFVTYILIPTSMVLMILVYIFFNIRIIFVTLSLDSTLISDLDRVEVGFKYYGKNQNDANEPEIQEVEKIVEVVSSKPKSLSMKKKK